jgi:hypothetical protein
MVGRECCGGLVHAIGAVPILRHVEPLWQIVTAAE